MSSLLQLSNLKKHFVDGSGQILQILEGIDLQLKAGDSLAILGRSGSGKSTLLHLIGGLEQPTEGTVLFEGQSIYSLGKDKISEYRNQQVGFVFQQHHLLSDFSALENVMIPGMIGGKSEKEARILAEALLNEVGLAHRMHHKPTELSGGEQQRTAIARALINQPRLLLCDEPTGNLDRDNESMIAELLQQSAKKQGAILILVTHNPALAGELDRTLQLKQGKLNE